MLSFAFALLFFACAALLLALAARSDWNGLVIPNEYSLALGGVFLFGVAMPGGIFDGVHLVSGLGAGLVVFVATIILYAARAMGGGDTKLASATALLVGIHDLGLYLMVMACSGGALAVYAILTRKHGDLLLPKSPRPGTWPAQLKDGANKLPYGLAIAAGGVAALFVKWLAPYLAAR